MELFNAFSNTAFTNNLALLSTSTSLLSLISEISLLQITNKNHLLKQKTNSKKLKYRIFLSNIF